MLSTSIDDCYFVLLLCAVGALGVKGNTCEQSDPVDNYVPLSFQCCPYLGNLTRSLSSFLNCSVWNAKPFKVCSKCLLEYQTVRKTVDALNDDTTSYNGSTCAEQLLSSDKEALIYKAIQDELNVWSKSQCDKCYVSDSYDDNITVNLSNDTRNFFHLNKLARNCFHLEELQGGNVCQLCKAVYHNLNTFYSSLGSTSQICMDIVDLMNITRQSWSAKYHCLEQHKDTLSVAFTAAFICCLPILLYGGAAILEKKYQNEVLKRKPTRAEYETLDGVCNPAYSPSIDEVDETDPNSEELLLRSNNHVASSSTPIPAKVPNGRSCSRNKSPRNSINT